VHNPKFNYFNAVNGNHDLYEPAATTDSDNESEFKENELASIDSVAGNTKPRMHIHKVGCKKCGKPWTCWDDEDCSDLIQGAYCDKPNSNNAGICKWRYTVLTNKGHKLVSICCEK